jgi:hypothetical protein
VRGATSPSAPPRPLVVRSTTSSPLIVQPLPLLHVLVFVPDQPLSSSPPLPPPPPYLLLFATYNSIYSALFLPGTILASDQASSSFSGDLW